MDLSHYSTTAKFEGPRILQAVALDSLEERCLSNRMSTINDCNVAGTVRFRQLDCPNAKKDTSLNNMAKCTTYLTETLKILRMQEESPKQKRIIFLLDLTNTVVRSESNFNELTSTQALQQLILIVNPTKLDTEEEVKLGFLKLLNSILLHLSGVKWLTQTNYWVDVYSLILQYQRIDNNKILEPGYFFLATLLEKAVEENISFCFELIQFMASPIFLALQELRVSISTSVIVYTRKVYDNISPHGTCLAEVLELLLEHRSTKILDVFLKMKLREACDNLASISNDQDFSILMYRVVIMLSFYEISETFDGIEVINHNPLDLSGLHRIFWRETEKANITVVLELCYYAIKYFKNKGINLPRHQGKEKSVDIECEIMCLQLTPGMVVAEFLGNKFCNYLDDFRTDLQYVVMRHVGIEILRDFSVRTFKYGYALREKVLNGTLDDIIQCFDVALKTKAVYSMKSINRILMCLCFSLKDIYEYFRDVVKKRVISYEEQMLTQKIFDIIVDFMETPNISLDVRLIYLDIPTVMINILYTISWSSPVVIKGLRFLKLVVAKHLTPEMSLLMDTIKDSGMVNIGHMLFVKLFSSDWEIRQVALSVVEVIAHTANNSFPSFREILSDASLPELVATLCIEDSNPLIRAAAFKCLQEVSVIEGIERKLRVDELTDKVLATILSEEDPLAKKEAIAFLSVIYWYNKDEEDYKQRKGMYTCLEMVALMDKNHLVQQEVLRFWRKVVSKYMIAIGWVDKTFPPAIFSKKIIQLTNDEIGRRIFNLLIELNDTPCLNVIKHFCDSSDLSEEVSALLDEWLDEFYGTYRKYQVTEESLRLLEDYPNISSVSTFFSTSDAESYTNETEEMMDIVINECLHDAEVNEEHLGSTSEINLCEIPPLTLKAGISPSEFVRLIYNKVKMRKEPEQQPKHDEYVLDY